MNILKNAWKSLLALPLLVAGGNAFAGTLLAAGPTYPTDVVVGETYDVSVSYVNNSTAPQDVGDVRMIVLAHTPSCGTSADPFSDCPLPDPDVFGLSATGTGSDNCVGINFDIVLAVPATGEVAFVPNPLVNVDLAKNEVCTINFQATVLKLPMTGAGSPDYPTTSTTSQRARGAGFHIGTDAPGVGAGASSSDVADCSVEVDKQVSCDGGVTWIDQGLETNNEVAGESCTGIYDLNDPSKTDQIMVRYVASNTGAECPLTNCQWSETNGAFGNPSPISLADGETTAPIPATNDPLCSDSLDDDEPDMITITCDTPYEDLEQETVTVTAKDTATFQCQSTSLLVDRVVACTNGAPAGAVDQTLVKTNDDGTNGCSTAEGNDVLWGYAACNDGERDLYSCEMVDTDSAVRAAPLVVGDLPSDPTCATPFTSQPTDTNVIACDEVLEDAEDPAGPNNGKITINCCTKDVALVDCLEADRVTAYDRSTVECLSQSTLEITKECVDDPEDGTDDGTKVTVSINDDGDLGFKNCGVVDVIYRENDTCEGDLGTGEEVVVAGPFDIAPGDEPIVIEESFNPPLEDDACNAAAIVCENEDGQQLDPQIAVPQVCTVIDEGCITHSPGYWGTHPNAAAALIPVQVCGQPIASVEPEEVSTTEAICSVGKDAKILGDQTTQLIRQCTAAALNFAVSATEEGSCTQFDQDTFADCCSAPVDDGNYCSGEDEGGLSVSECIGLLDYYNNSIDTLQTDFFDDYSPADPTKCKASKNNGYQPMAPGLEPPPKPGKGPK